MNKAAVLVATVVLAGCASDPARYANTPSAKLCVDYLSPGGGLVGGLAYGLTQEGIEMELKRRREDCSNPAYLSAAQARIDSRAKAEAASRPIEVNVHQK